MGSARQNTRCNQICVKPEAAKSPLLRREKASPQKATTVDRTKTHDDQEPRTCRTAANSRQHAHAQAPGRHSSCRNPTALQGVLKASTKNAGLSLTPPQTPTQQPERRASNKSKTATWTPRSEASAKNEGKPDLPEPAAAKVLQANTVKSETDQREALARSEKAEHRHKLT